MLLLDIALTPLADLHGSTSCFIILNLKHQAAVAHVAKVIKKTLLNVEVTVECTTCRNTEHNFRDDNAKVHLVVSCVLYNM